MLPPDGCGHYLTDGCGHSQSYQRLSPCQAPWDAFMRETETAAIHYYDIPATVKE
ncbi:MAG: hypothetical protein LBS55_09590 [Prevotellaceae bacterium]|jgi:hypothetical protein|nr:hypothetical protein [Prevotellaceae bacterium]